MTSCGTKDPLHRNGGLQNGAGLELNECDLGILMLCGQLVSQERWGTDPRI